jgi:hypothetical protein
MFVFSPGRGIHNAIFLANNPGLTAGVGRERMFNIVKRRDFMLTDDSTREEPQRLCDEKYGLDHFVIQTAQSVPARSRPSADGGSRMVKPSSSAMTFLRIVIPLYLFV